MQQTTFEQIKSSKRNNAQKTRQKNKNKRKKSPETGECHEAAVLRQLR